ncbi:MAG: DNA mismatch repair endonuclease MutL [Cyanobacteria bacterium J06626_14]
MPLTIQPLPIDAVHLIGAGEVIDSLAAAVRELAENAIDANATRVAIAVDMTQWAVRVADNGHGMSLDDLRQAARPHTTSKIQNSQDLKAINSLGFRGEALHSLAQLAQLEINSYQIDTDEGWHVQYDVQGDVTVCESKAIAPGTIVTATHLFASWPQRRDAMPSAAQQLRQIQRTVQSLALCHPHITWTVTQGERDWFSIFPGATAKTILPQCVRDIEAENLHEQMQTWSDDDADLNNHTSSRSDLTTQSSQLYLLAGLPDRCHRRRADWIKVAVNGRMIQCPELEQSMIGAFRRTLVRDRYPVCVAHLTVPIDHVDWNRQPAKQEVYLHQLELWQERLRGAIAHLLSLHQAQLPDSYFASRLGQLIKSAESDTVYRLGNNGSIDRPQDQPLELEGEELSASLKPDADQDIDDSQINTLQTHQSPIPLRAIAQVHQMYILAEHPEGMWLIEQHIAHERILYEQLCDQWKLVPVEPPVILSQLSSAQQEQLQRLNIDIEPFGEQLWAARTVPAVLAAREDCKDALMELSKGGDMDSAIVATACRTAIRNGTPLSLADMQQLVDQWIRTRHPRTCPHGRPIYLKLEESRLSRFFRRHWVVGKSHGI